jgi:hypothetical protein
MYQFCDSCLLPFATLTEIRIPNRLLHYCADCVLRYYRNKNLKCKYGITLEQQEKHLAEQDYSCAMCPTNITNRAFQDYNHKLQKGQPGFLRGLLCQTCHKKLNWYENHKLNLSDDWYVTNKRYELMILKYLEDY